MNTLTKRNALLISQGCNQTGSFSEGVWYVEEQLYCDEIDEIEKFCKWLDANSHRSSAELPFVEHNYPNLFKNYYKKNL